MTGYSIIMNGSGKKFSEKFMVQKIIKTRISHVEFREILIKIDLMVRIKVSIFNIFKKLTIARISPKMFLHFDGAHFHESWSLK